MSVNISPLSLIYVKQEVLSPADPTALVVSLAFLPFAQRPTSGDWIAGSWETINGHYYARCLVGPGGAVTLSTGRYQIWVRVADSPEIPVLRGDEITVGDD